jgi:serine/threonine protein kinase
VYVLKKEQKMLFIVIGISGMIVLALSLVMLFMGDQLNLIFDVIGIRVAAIFIAFATFLSSMLFSLLILMQHKTTLKINDDTNKRAEMFRELQFASSNYSIIDFIDRMLIYQESSRYIEKLIKSNSMMFHMLEKGIDSKDISINPNHYHFLTIRIPFKVIEGKLVSSITFDKLRFERDGIDYEFFPPEKNSESRAFLLHNERTKRNNSIINLIMRKDSAFYKSNKVNHFTKIKIYINITSLLGVKVKGNSELYFTNPEQIEGDNTNTYAIHSSNFLITEQPKIIKG